MFSRQVNNHLWISGNEYFHFYLITGKSSCVLVGTGISATAGIVLRQFFELAVKPDYLIVSHPRNDQITGLEYLKRSFSQAAVIAGKGAESFITHPKNILNGCRLPVRRVREINKDKNIRSENSC